MRHDSGVSYVTKVTGSVTTKSGDVIKNNDVIIRDVPPSLIPVVAGLTSQRKRVPFWYLFDTRGVVTTSNTYGVWQKEYSILQSHSDDIASKTSSPVILVELGSGASSKTRLVIEAMLRRHGSLEFVPVDVSKEHIEEVGHQLELDYEGLTVKPFGGLYMDGVRHLSTRNEPKMMLFLGNSFSNTCLHEQVDMMKDIRAQLTTKDRLVLGLDMNKDRDSLLEAYGQQWVTFQKDNPIGRLNKDFDGDMDAAKFELVTDVIEKPTDGDTPNYVMGYWRSLAAQRVKFRRLGLNLDFQSGEKFFFTDGPNWTELQVEPAPDTPPGGEERLTWADITFFNTLGWVTPLDPTVLDRFPNLTKVMGDVQYQQGIARWLKERPQTNM
ncbi:histidine N-alpha-methyltransferase-like [Branchiostoma lanceolatum]|uniref:histidine N-alpha-methyltransferase-like n=1 Tax=Branchiostoma lanceolatum TaxID=7740 RepID=UPI0034559B99